MISKEILRKSFGYPFTTKKQVLKAMDYKDYNQIRQFFYDLPHIKSKYFTDDVIEKIIAEVNYSE